MRSASTAAVSVTDGSSSGPPRMQPETRARTGRHTIAHHRDVLSHGAGTVWSAADPPILSTRRAVRCLGRETVRENVPVECQLLLASPVRAAAGAGQARRSLPSLRMMATRWTCLRKVMCPRTAQSPASPLTAARNADGPHFHARRLGSSLCDQPGLAVFGSGGRRSSPKCSDDPQMGRRTTQSRLRWDGRRRKQQLACAATLRIDTLGDQPVPGQPRRTHVAPLHRGAATRRLSLGR